MQAWASGSRLRDQVAGTRQKVSDVARDVEWLVYSGRLPTALAGRLTCFLDITLQFT